jgi:glycosyltransferase involved in cell wall biosynthesis
VGQSDQAGRVRICYLIGSLKRCGTAVHLFGVLRNLDRSRYTPWVVGLAEPGPVAEDIRSLGVEVDQFDLRSIYAPATLRTAFWLARKIRRTRVEVVQSYLFFDNLIGPLAARLGGAPVVITGRRTVDEWETPRHRRLYRLTNSQVNQIVVVSEEVRQSVLRWERVEPAKVTLITNAQSRETLLARTDPADDPALAELRAVTDGGFLFGTVGNVRPIKGHDLFVQAFARVREVCPNSHVVIVGGGPSLPLIEAMVKERGLESSVHLVGHRANVAGFLDLFDAFVLPSRAEGMSNALLEALIFGKPVISSRFGLPRNGRGEDVVLGVEAGNVDELAQAMIRVCREPELRRTLSENAREYTAETMDERGMVRAYQDLYEGLLATPSAMRGGRP